MRRVSVESAPASLLSSATKKPPMIGDPLSTLAASPHLELMAEKHSANTTVDSQQVFLRARTLSSGNKPRSNRSGTASSKDFPMRMLKREKAKTKRVQFDSATMLLHLCQFPDERENHLEMVKKCLDLENEGNVGHLDVNNTYSPQQWLTPLHIACSYGHVDIARLLIEKAGAAVNITDKEGWTPLHCACAEGQVDIVKMLLKVQGKIEEINGERRKDWIYAVDGPINLEQENNDGDIPEEVSLEDKEDMIKNILKGIRIFLN